MSEETKNVVVKEREKKVSELPPLDLDLNLDTIKQEIIVVEEEKKEQTKANPQLEKMADDLVDKLLSIDPEKQAEEREKYTESIENLGVKAQKESVRRNELMQQPINKLFDESKDGSQVADSLLELKNQVNELNPNKFDFKDGWFTRTFGKLPFVGSKLEQYFDKYRSSQSVINEIINSLEEGRETLKRDNISLVDEKLEMRKVSLKLIDIVEFGKLVEQKIENKLESDIASNDPRYDMLQQEVLFPLKQRIIDLEQQRAVNQQGVIATDLIIRNNKELIRGVGRALNVTVTALRVGVMTSLALNNQKIVLDKIDALNETTSELILQNAKRLRQQGTEIHKQASSAMLDMEKLKQSFVEVEAALDDIANYRKEALPVMSEQIQEMSDLTAKAEKAIQKMEKGAEEAEQYVNIEKAFEEKENS